MLIMVSPEPISSFVFYTHWGKIRLTDCFRGIARLNVFYCVSHALGQHPTNELLLWYHPNSTSILRFTCFGSIPGYRLTPLECPSGTLLLRFACFARMPGYRVTPLECPHWTSLLILCLTRFGTMPGGWSEPRDSCHSVKCSCAIWVWVCISPCNLQASKLVSWVHALQQHTVDNYRHPCECKTGAA